MTGFPFQPDAPLSAWIDSDSAGDDSRLRQIAQLQEQVDACTHDSERRWLRENNRTNTFSSGCSVWDAKLLAGGFSRGSLTEWFTDRPGIGAQLLTLGVAYRACGTAGVCDAAGVLVVVDPDADFYPPAAAAWGLDLQRIVLIRPSSSDVLWALDQALRCPAVSSVWCRVGKLNDRWFRRFQLAVESSGVFGVLLRSTSYLGQPSWSDLQFIIQPRLKPTDKDLEETQSDPPSSYLSHEERYRWHVELIRCRKQGRLGSIDLEADEPHGTLRTIA